VRFAATDRRTGAAFLWCALIVLAWALLSVLFSGSAAHADDRGRDPHPSAKAAVSNAHALTQKAPTVPHRAVTANAQAESRGTAKPAAPHRTAAGGETVRAASAGQRAVAAVSSSVKSIRPVMDAKIDRVSTALKGAAAEPERKPHPHADGVRGNGHRPKSEDARGHGHLPAHANARAHAHADGRSKVHAHGKHAHAAPADRAGVVVAGVVAVATTAPASQAESPAAAEHEPGSRDAHSLSAPPATPSSAASAMQGAAPGAALLPDDVRPALSREILFAARTDDDTLPSGPIGSTDVSPD